MNPRYGAIGMFMIPYMMFYELYCPFFIILGWFVIIASTLLKLINVPYVIYVFLLYVLLGTLLTITMFIDKIFMKNDYFSALDVVKSLGVALADAFFFRPYLFFIEFIAFFKYKKISSSWSSPARVKVISEE